VTFQVTTWNLSAVFQTAVSSDCL